MSAPIETSASAEWELLIERVRAFQDLLAAAAGIRITDI
jgi:hypothetical protein